MQTNSVAINIISGWNFQAIKRFAKCWKESATGKMLKNSNFTALCIVLTSFKIIKFLLNSNIQNEKLMENKYFSFW